MGRPFGWDLPPGVSQRMLNEIDNGPEPSKEAEAFLEIFEPAVDCLRDGVLKVETLESLQEATVELIEHLVSQRDYARLLLWGTIPYLPQRGPPPACTCGAGDEGYGFCERHSTDWDEPMLRESVEKLFHLEEP